VNVRVWSALTRKSSPDKPTAQRNGTDEADDSRGHAGHRPAGRHSNPSEGGSWLWDRHRAGYEFQLQVQLQQSLPAPPAPLPDVPTLPDSRLHGSHGRPSRGSLRRARGAFRPEFLRPRGDTPRSQTAATYPPGAQGQEVIR